MSGRSAVAGKTCRENTNHEEMSMVRMIMLLLGGCLLLLATGCTCPMGKPQQSKEGQRMGHQGKQTQQRQDVLYTCNCGPGCTCNTVSTSPGVCRCGAPLKWGHIVRVEGEEAILCQCAEGCTCTFNPQDPTSCSCGKPLKRVSLKGSGLYFCNCGGSCMCNTVSDQPGKCRCTMDLKKVD
jgi:hypothetical protein